MNNDYSLISSVREPTVMCRDSAGQQFCSLIDSGSRGGQLCNYISKAVVTRNRYESGGCICPCITTCTPTGCFKTKTCVTIKLSLISSQVTLDNIYLDFRVIEGLPDDSIIGLESIREHSLTRVFDHLFTKEEESHAVVKRSSTRSVDYKPDVTTSKTVTRQPICEEILPQYEGQSKPAVYTETAEIQRNTSGSPKVSTPLSGKVRHKQGRIQLSGLSPGTTASGEGRHSTITHDSAMPRPLSVIPIRSVSFTTRGNPGTENSASRPSNAILRQTLPGSLPVICQSSTHTTTTYLCEMTEKLYISKEDLLDIEDDDDQIGDYIDPSPYEDWINSTSTSDPNADNLSRIRIFFPESMVEERKALWKVLVKYRTVFSKEVAAIPARIEPFVLTESKDSDWNTSNRHKQSSRLQSPAKQAAINKFIEKALELKVIVPSQATSWSQVHLTKKPDNTWRFCIDFRGLNSVTQSMGWPIPIIIDILQRIGARKPKWFAIFDLTSGYNQAPVAEKSRFLTAFRCSLGLFEWNRLPMGLKGAGSYFQHHMSNTVLKGLVTHICDVYMDDIEVDDQTPMGLIERLTRILERARLHNIKFNPDKVRIGMTEVEYCGHVIDESGLSFSKEKSESVLNFALPQTHAQMKSFLGLTSQFRDHVQNYGTLAAPLHGMIPNYKKNSKLLLQWTDELIENFKTLQRQVSGCQKLYFLNEDSPVFLHTDASNYGIGAYLYQVVDGIRYPIMFISRQLNACERKWSTIEKEAFAIFFAFQKTEHLIRDRYFVLRTDALNLTFLNTDHREKVKRWKLAIQEYDFKIEHIPGKENIEADAFSRLVPFPEPMQAWLNTMRQRITNATPDASSHLPTDIYKQIEDVHGGIYGHGGVERTLSLLRKQQRDWPGMRKHVTIFIRRCACCQKMSKVKPLITIKPFVLSAYDPMQRICIDAIGPIREEGQEEEYNYILVIIDAFSRYVNLYAVKDTTAQSALSALTDWICTFGCPSEIVSDNGTQFVNNLITAFLGASKIKHALINAYSSEENGIVERANKEVNRHVESMAYDTLLRANWKQNLPFIKRILNTMVHTSIGVSPSQLIFGDAINHDAHFLYEPTSDSDHHTYSKAVSEMYAAQERLLIVARQTQQELDSFHLAQRDPGDLTSFAMNSYVLAQYETSKPSKFSTNLHGPYRVVNINGPIYTLQNLVTDKCVDFHIRLLREFRYDPDHVDPVEVAKHDKEYDDIQQILGHRFTGKQKRRSDLEFHLLWARDSEPRWERWNSSLGANETVHKYLQKNKLRRLIQPIYTWPKDHPEYIPPDKGTKNNSAVQEPAHPRKAKTNRDSSTSPTRRSVRFRDDTIED